MRLRLVVIACVLQVVAGSTARSAVIPGRPTPAVPSSLSPEVTSAWAGSNGRVVWPPSDGFAGPATLIVLPPGMLLDRFGEDGGHLSPRGASYEARALPYVCAGLRYTAYRVLTPLLGWAGHAAQWFGQAGGATQIETDATAAQLIADHILEPVDLPPSVTCPTK